MGEPEPRITSFARWRDAVSAIAISCAILALATGVGLGVGKVFDIYNPSDAPRAFAAGEADALTTLRLALVLFAFQAVMVALTIMAAQRFAARGVELLPFAAPRGGAPLLAAAVAGLILLALLFGLSVYTFDRSAFVHDTGMFSNLMQSRVWWLMLLAAGIGAPLAEELLFRGYLFGVLRGSPIGLIGGAAVSAAMWAVVHPGYSMYGVAMIGLVGVYLALLKERTGSLVMPVVCHALYNNLIVLTIAFLPPGTFAG